jgi:DNA processing protein
MTTSRLRALLAHHRPDEALAVIAGRARPAPLVADLCSGPVGAAWRAAATRQEAGEWARRCRLLGIRAVAAGDDDFPVPLRRDPDPPAVLFVRGDLAALDRRRVGIVGTRNATGAGRELATALGHDLAVAGVAVVSGLAKGIDGAAHRGVLRARVAPPVAVVGNGPDRAYPRVHTDLWSAVAEHGVLMSESPPGTAPEPFRFPLRNRIIAALSEVVVVVESRERGGSLITAMAAAERGVDVMAVPGSPHSRASIGANQLLRDGAAPVTDAADVLVALGLDHCRAGRAPFDPRPRPRGLEADVLACVQRDPCPLDTVVAALRVPLLDAAMAVARLERAGWVREAGGWFEAVGPWGVDP